MQLKLSWILLLALKTVLTSPLGGDIYQEATLERSEELRNKDLEDLEISAPKEETHSFTSEKVDKNRWVSIDKYGIKRESSDSEVIQILQKAANIQSSVATEPSQPLHHQVSKRIIVGTDDRFPGSTAAYPGRATGFLMSGCTAFLIGPYHAVTAGHCVYGLGGWKVSQDDLDLDLRRDCGREGYYMEWEQAWVLNGWLYGFDFNYDMAFILYNENTRSRDWLGIAYERDLPSESLLCGYPFDKTRWNICPPNCFYCSSCSSPYSSHCTPTCTYSGLILNCTRTLTCRRISHYCDSVGGYSGGPFYMYSPTYSYWLAYGVQSSGDNATNYAVQFTPDRIMLLRNFTCYNGGYNCD